MRSKHASTRGTNGVRARRSRSRSRAGLSGLAFFMPDTRLAALTRCRSTRFAHIQKTLAFRDYRGSGTRSDFSPATSRCGPSQKALHKSASRRNPAAGDHPERQAHEQTFSPVTYVSRRLQVLKATSMHFALGGAEDSAWGLD